MYKPPELWEALLPRLQVAHKSGVSLRAIADFCDASPKTILRWLSNQQSPTGEKLIKVWCFLESLGEPSRELRSIPVLNACVMKLYAFDIITMEEALEVFGLKNPQDGFNAMRGRPVINAKYSVDDLNELYLGQLYDAERRLSAQTKSARAEVFESVEVPSSEPTRRRTSRVTEYPVSTPVVDLVPGNTGAMLFLASELAALVPLVRYALSDQCSPENRSFLREQLTQEQMFELSNLLNALCSERARNQAR